MVKAIWDWISYAILTSAPSLCLASFFLFLCFWGVFFGVGSTFGIGIGGFLAACILAMLGKSFFKRWLREEWMAHSLAAIACSLFPVQGYLLRYWDLTLFLLPLFTLVFALLFCLSSLVLIQSSSPSFRRTPVTEAPAWGTEEVHQGKQCFTAISAVLVTLTTAVSMWLTLDLILPQKGFLAAAYSLCLLSLFFSLILRLHRKHLRPRSLLLHIGSWLIVIPSLILARTKMPIVEGTEVSGHRSILKVKHFSPDPIILLEGRASIENPGLPFHQLFLGNRILFDSQTEQSLYHCFTDVPALAADLLGSIVRNVLIVGGGTGIAARDLLTFTTVKHITILEEISPIIDLAKNELKLRIYNLDALRDRRVKVVNDHHSRWLTGQAQQFDLILVERLEPKHHLILESLSLLAKHLTPNGVLVVLTTSTFPTHETQKLGEHDARQIVEALKKLKFKVELIYERDTLSRFYIASRMLPFSLKKLTKKLGLLSYKSSPCIYQGSWMNVTKSAAHLANYGVGTQTLARAALY